MKPFVKRLRREEGGFTLIELVAALSLVSVVLGVIYATIMFGVHAYERVQVQNSLRDEGDLVMSSIMAKLYTFGPEKLIQVDEAGRKGVRLITAAGGAEAEESLLFQDDGSGKGQLVIAGEPLELTASLETGGGDGSAILLGCEGGGEACSSGLLTIRLKLLQAVGGENYTLNVESKFGF